MTLSRRDLLLRVGQAGGYTAAFTTLQALGVVPMKTLVAEPIAAATNVGRGVHVVVLGGGIGGLVSAYELRRHGYTVTVLEVRSRPGGRNWSVRGGTTVEFVDGEKQYCRWAAGHYQNMGPARLPSIHATMLGYCRELGVPLEVEVNASRSSLLQNDKANDGKPLAQRRVVTDTRGHVSELLAKCVAQGALDAEVTREDRERMVEFLKLYGGLDKDAKYAGSPNAGYTTIPGAGPQVGVMEETLSMRMLLDEAFWNDILYEEQVDWQATMMQPVGGMDRIPYAFANSLGKIVHYNAEVKALRKTSRGVRVEYTQQGAAKATEAEFCVCALPLTQLRKVQHDLDAAHTKVVNESTYAPAYKVAWEAPRFWETKYNIYGGLSFLSQGPSPIWYPSAGLMSETGVLVTGYSDERQGGFENLTTAQKFEVTRAQVEKLHPGHGADLKNPMFVGWKRVPWNEGSWIESYGNAVPRTGGRSNRAGSDGDMEGYKTITEPDGAIFFAGDHTSHQVGWQEGAALSAKRAVQSICDRTTAARG
jgi:monoamine oxidase